MKKFFARPVILPPGYNQHLFFVKVLTVFFFLSGILDSYASEEVDYYSYIRSYYDFEVNGIYYNILSESEKTVEVTYKERLEIDGSSTDPIYRCAYRQRVIIPQTVTHNGITYRVTRIGDHAFQNSGNVDDSYGFITYDHLTGLYDIYIPEGIEEIGESAVRDCRSLNLVILPKTVKSIGKLAFGSLPPSHVIVLLGETPPNIYDSFVNVGVRPIFIVPQKSHYLSDDSWAKYSERIFELITPKNSAFTYNGKTHEFEWTDNSGQLSELLWGKFELNLLSDTVLKSCNAGTYSEIISYEFVVPRYSTYKVQGSFTYNYTINKAPLHLGIKDADRVYGDENPEFTYSSISGFIDGEGIANLDSKPQLSTTATVKSDVGEYPISAIVEAQNYEFDGKCGTLTVTPAPLDVTVCNAERMYGESNPEFEVSYKGLKGKDILNPPTGNFQFNTSADLKSNVGNYPVEVVGGNLHNYTPTYHSGNLKITGAKLLLSGIDAEKIYGNENPSFQYAASGFKFPEDKLSTEPSFSCNADIYSTPGQYPISLSGAEAQNYNIEYKHGILSVQKRELTASIGHYKMHYGEDVPDFFVNYNGFVNRENYTDIDVPASIEIWCDNPEKPDAGAWYVVPHSAEDDHYTFKYEYGTLEVYKANQSIEWGEMHEDCLVGDQFELTAVASTGLPVSYKVNDGRIASIYSIGNTYYLDCIAPGEVVITATQAGNNNYAPVSDEKRLTISEESSIGEITISESDLDSPIYNMQGIQVKNLIKGQIYIKNGKKFIAK